MGNTDISGQITDESGNSIANAEVYLWREDLAGAGGVVASTTADSSGKFAFTEHPDGSGSTESWHVAAKDPNANVQLQSAYGVTASPPTSVNSQFDVSITDASPDPVVPGETLTVDASLTNSGTDSDTQTITLDINNGVGQVDSALETAQGGGGDAFPTFSWEVPSGQTEQDYTATVSSADDSDSTTVSVQSAVQIVDNFEDNDIAEYGGDTGKFQTQSGAVYAGTYALRADADDQTGDGVAGMASTSGLDNYPSQGDVFECRFRGDNSPKDILIHWGSQSASVLPNGYEGRMDFNNQDLGLAVRNGGFNPIASDSSPTFNTGQWYRLEVTWKTDGAMTVTVEEDDGTQIASVSATDTTYSSGGVGFFVSDGSDPGTGYWDEYQIIGSP